MLSSFYDLILSAIMALKKGVVLAAVVLTALLGIGECSSWFAWPSGDTAGGEKVASVSVEPKPPSLYNYPAPTFIEDNVTAMAALTGNDTIIQWIKDHPWIYGVIGGTVLIVVVLLVAFIVCCCCYCRRRRGRSEYHPGSPEDGPQKDVPRGKRKKDKVSAEERRKQREIEERKTAVDAVKGFMAANQVDYLTRVDDAGNLPSNFKLPEMGSRMQKYWFMVDPAPSSQQQPPEFAQLIITAAPVSQKCPLKLDEQMLRGVNKLIGALKPHPYLHKIIKIDYRYDTKQVIIVQPYMTSGSLKDIVYKVSPTTDWSKKYSRRSKGLPTDKIRRYGRQILEAMTFLYGKGFPILGHVQSGNIFVDDDDICRLGGYENTLLGYKTRLYRLCRNHLQHFDVIMFGHLIFEMSCGYELTQLRPGPDEYSGIKDSEIREILDYIFKDSFPNSIEKIKDHHFFSVELVKPEFDSKSIELSDHMKKVVDKVCKAKPREQSSEPPTPSFVDKIKQNIRKTTADKEEPPQAAAAAEVTVHSGGSGTEKRSASFMDKLKLSRKKDKDEAPESEKLLAADGDDKEPKDT